MSRARTVLASTSIAAVAIMLAGCEPGNSASSRPGGPERLTYVSYGGSAQDAQIQAFQKSYSAAHPNVSFANTSPADVAQVKAQVHEGVITWDVVSVAPAAAKRNCGTLFERLTVPGVNTADLAPDVLGECYVGDFLNATIFGYNAGTYPDPAAAPQRLADFFDTARFPGKRGVVTNLQNGILEYPLLADGIPPERLYPLDIGRALARWAAIREDTVFAPNVGALQQAVSSGEVDMFLLSDSRVIALLNDQKNIKLVWDTTVVSINGLAVPKGSRHKATAEDFLAWVVRPEQSARISELLATVPVNTKANPSLTTNGKRMQVYGPANTGKTVVQDIDWYARHWDEVTARLGNWLAG